MKQYARSRQNKHKCQNSIFCADLVAQHQLSQQWVSTIVWDQFQEMRRVTLCLAPGPLYTGHSTFCSSIQIRFPPSPSPQFHVRTARPPSQAHPPHTADAVSRLSVSGHSDSDSVYRALHTPFRLAISNIESRKKGFWCFVNSLCFVDLETDIPKLC